MASPKNTSWSHLKNLVVAQDKTGIKKYLGSLNPLETARAITHLHPKVRSQLIDLLTPDEALEVIRDLPEEGVANIIREMDQEDRVAIIDKMPSDEQADVLADLNKSESEAILRALPQDEANRTREILKYPEHTAGSIMSVEYLFFKENQTAGEVLDNLQQNIAHYSDYYIQYAYVVSTDGVLKGVLRMRDLVLSAREKPISTIMIANPISVQAETQLNELINIFEENRYLGIPVIDKQKRLIGVISKEKAMEEVGTREKDSYLKTRGIVGGEEFRSMPLLQRSRRRLSWLGINILLNLLSASVIAAYQDTLASAIALAVFLPIISDMSGNSGNQAVAVSLRELTLGLTQPMEVMHVLSKEIFIGLINGLVLGLVLGLVAVIWKGNFYLGIVAGGALAINTVVAVCLGGTIPLILKRLKKDPALASSPILTTITDMCGFFLALSFATHFLPKLI